MKLRRNLFVGSFLVAFSMAQIQATPIIWDSATTIGADTQVSNLGSMSYAYTQWNSGTTVNGVSFTSVNSNTSWGGGNVTLSFPSSTSTNQTTFSAPTGISSAYGNLLRGAAYGGVGTGTFTLNNLTSGRAYITQIWVNDSRATGGSRTETVTSVGGNSVTLDYNSTEAVGGAGQFTIGRFLADATSQAFTMSSTTSVQLNALQVRDVTNIGNWVGTGGATWDASTTNNFASNLFNAALNTTTSNTAATSLNAVTFADSYWSSNTATTVTQTSVTVGTGGVSTGRVYFDNNAVNYTFSSADANGIRGSTMVVKNGTGTVTLAGANTYTGGTIIGAGTLRIGHATALGGNAGVVSVASGAVLDLNGTTMTGTNALTLNGSGISSGGALTNSSATAGTYAGLVTLGSASSIVANSGNIILSNAGTITGSGFGLTLGGTASGSSIASIIGTGAGGITKQGTGTWTLSGANTYTGGTTISAGTLRIGHATALGGNAGGVSVASGAVLDLNGTTMTGTNALTLNGSGISSGGALTNSSATAGTYAGLVTLGSASSIVADSGNIILSNTGTITGSGFGLTLGGTASGSSIASIIGTGAGGITKQGTGTWTLSGANTYTGGTTISAGTLRIGHATALGGNAGVVSVASGAVLDLNGTTMTGTNALTLNGSGISSGGALTNSSATAGTYAGLVTLGSASSIVANSGNIILSNAGTITGAGFGLTLGGTASGSIASIIETGTGGITKQGSGTWTLSGANTYSGGTSIENGTLQAQVVGTSLTPTSPLGSGTVTLNGGTLQLRASGTANSTSETVTFGNNVSVAADATIDVNRTGSSSTTKSLVLGALSIGANTLNSTGGNSYALRFNGATTLTGNAIFNPTSANIILAGLIGESGGARSITKTGSGTLTLNLFDSVTPIASTFSGGVNILAGTLVLANTLGSGGQQTSPGGNASASYQLGDTSGSASATLALANNNIIFNNPITVRSSAGGVRTLSVSGSSVNASQGGTITLDENLTLSTAATNSSLTINGVIQNGANGAKGITVSSSGAVRLTNTNHFTGTTLISSGTLQIGNGGTTGSLSPSSSITNNGNLTFNRSNTLTQGTDFANGISGSGTITQSGTGTTILSGTNSFTGNVSASSGILRITSSSALGSGTKTVSVVGSVYLELDGSNGDISLAATTSFNTSGNGIYGIRNLAGNNVINGVVGIRDGAGNGTIISNGGSLELANTVSATVTGGRTVVFSGTSSGDNKVSGQIIDGTSTLSVSKAGTGLWSFTRTDNTYTGATALSNGVLSVASIANGGSSSSIGSSSSAASNLVFDGGTLRYTGATTASDRAFTINADKTATIDVSSSSANLSLVGATGTATNGGLSKQGDGTLTLTGTNTYTGNTSVAAGKLVINGSVSTVSAITVANNATLGGSGSMGAVTIQSGGNLSPGNSPGVITQQSLTFADNANFNIEIDKSLNPTNDRVDLTGNVANVLSITDGANLFLNLSGTFALGDCFVIVSYIGENATWNGGRFHLGNGSTLLEDDSKFVFGGYDWRINYDDTNFGPTNSTENYEDGGKYVTLTVIPEPGSALLGGIGVLLLLRRRRD